MKKKVLQVLGGIGFGGAETFVMNQFRKLQNNFIFDFAVQVHLNAENSYENEIKSLGGNIYYTGLFRTSPIAFSKMIESIVKEHGPYNAVHIHVNEQCGFAALGAKRAFNGPVIVHAHSSQYGQKNPIIKTGMLIANKFLVKKMADYFFACSYEAAEMYFGEYGRRKAIVIKNPIDIEHFFYTGEMHSCREYLGITSDELVISHIGRFVEVKNHEFIVKLCNKLKVDQVDFKMLLVGNGVLRRSIEIMVKNYNLEKNVIFLGERSDIPKILKASDVMILPSKFEGLPTVVLEAQATGTPSIVSLNVNRECDIGIDLVRFLSTDKCDSIQLWKTEIIKRRKRELNFFKISQAFFDKGISLQEISNLLVRYYQ